MENETGIRSFITIIIATYNADPEIRGCLQSIFDLAIDDLEIVVVDGKSSDGTLNVIKDLEHRGIKWISEEDNGIYDAFNKGVEMASGEWIYFLGSDDRLLKGFKDLLKELKDPHTVYYGNSKPYYSSKPEDAYGLLQGEFTNYRLAKYCMNHQSIIYPRSAFETQHYDLRYRVLADYAFNIALWGNKSFKKKFYPVSIVSYNMSGMSSNNMDDVFEKDKLKLIRENMGLIIYFKLLFRFLKRKIKG